MPTALITGASAGLGADFARQLAAKGADLVLVARTTQALQPVADEVTRTYGVETELIAADLTTDAGIATVADVIRSRRLDLLVNNAGFGIPQQFDENDVQVEVDHLRVHVEAPLVLTHAALNSMRRRGGRIILVASVAAFVPRSTYAANKRWLVQFAKWANVYYAKDNVSVTAVCPGFTHTNFHERMGMSPGHEGIPGPLWLDAPDVVAEALRDTARGKAVSIPSWRYKVAAKLLQAIPVKLSARYGPTNRV